MNSLAPSVAMMETTEAVDQHTYDAETGSDVDDDIECIVPIETNNDREDAEIGAAVNNSFCTEIEGRKGTCIVSI